MKKLFLLTLTAAVALSGFAKTAMHPMYSNGERSAASYKRLTLMGNLNIILVNDDTKTVEVADTKEAEQVSTTYYKNKLVVDGCSVNRNNPVTVRVPANQLEYLEVIGNVTVQTESNLNSPKLYVTIDGKGKVSLSNKGQIYVRSGDDINLKVEKATGGVVVDESSKSFEK
ncbi:MAG: DUF2807 domain-containing protein [Sediminibacterium sp.]|nr:DUF2807 domain-containing protein [Sediminibacterium sp.]